MSDEKDQAKNEEIKQDACLRFKIRRFYFDIGRAKSDVEKCVLPTILFINTNHNAFTNLRRKGFLLCFGWWDFSVKFGLFF